MTPVNLSLCNTLFEITGLKKSSIWSLYTRLCVVRLNVFCLKLLNDIFKIEAGYLSQYLYRMNYVLLETLSVIL